MLTTNLRANPTNNQPTCDEVLIACNLRISVLEDALDVYDKQLIEKDARIIELEKQISPTPWYYYVIGGILTGLAGRELLK